MNKGEILLFLGSDGGAKRPGCSNMILNIPNYARENAAVSGVFWDVAWVECGTQRPSLCNSGSLEMSKIAL